MLHFEVTKDRVPSESTATMASGSDNNTSNAAIVPYPVKVIKSGSKGKDVGRIQRA